jgi:UDP-N-acetylglucosamine 2-epimerase (non-hydrolysing)
MKILTILGTRPEIIRLSRIIPKLDQVTEQILVHTGQNYDASLNDIFFSELGIRNCDFVIDSKADTLAEQLGKIFVGVHQAISKHSPDKVLLLGDTNSSLAAIICERLNIPVYHMEAGNRCYDLRVPEEKNRKIIDAVSSVNMPYTQLSRENLLREGIANNKIFVTGNPINEVMKYYSTDIANSSVLAKLGLEANNYVIATAHRAENVDQDYRLKNIFAALSEIAKDIKVVFSCHPRTKEKLQKFGVSVDPNIMMLEPLGFFDFVNLESNAKLAITDSGTVQEEMCLLGKPTITIRDSTERPETVWCGSNIVSGLEISKIMQAYHRMTAYTSNWQPPIDYTRIDVSETVVNVILSN